jgi:H+/Cl- antiporter ClcA
MSKLFRVTVVLLVAIVSVALLAVLFSAVLSGFSLPMISDSNGIGTVAGGVSEKWIRLVFLLAVLISVCFLYWRGRKSR